MTPEVRQEKGIEAIIYLQSLYGITETREQAIKGWNGITLGEQDYTLALYHQMKRSHN